jgi:hypothetical protein
MQLPEESMVTRLESLLESFTIICKPERVFLALLVVFGTAAIILFRQGILPLPIEYFLFYSVLIFLFSLYRPVYVWSAVVFFLPFEVVTVALVGGADFRPYQWLVAVLFAALMTLFLQKKQRFPIVRWYDCLLSLIFAGAIIGHFVLSTPGDGGIKNILVIVSFAGLYGLGRAFVTNHAAFVATVKAFLASASVVTAYAFYQIFLFEKGGTHFMVMPGRPNSTFTEADWLGFFLGGALLVTTVLLVRAYQEKNKILLIALLALQNMFTIGLIATVSRSAWLGALLGLGFLVGVLFWRDKKLCLQLATSVVGIFFLAVAVVDVFHVTRFDLGQRLQSTTTTQQTITIACKDERILPEQVNQIAELSSYECRHIDLEAITAEQAAGSIIRTVNRPDPNITIRVSIYQQTFVALKNNWLLGLGPGSSTALFGVDSRGASLNSSNMFLEVWLLAGLLGFIGLSSFWFLSGALLMRSLVRRKTIGERWYILAGLLALWFHASTFNFFNAGLFLGEFALLLIFLAWYLEKKAPHIKNIWQR